MRVVERKVQSLGPMSKVGSGSSPKSGMPHVALTW